MFHPSRSRNKALTRHRRRQGYVRLLGLLVVGATAAATTLAPLDTALAKKDSAVRHVAYQQWGSAAGVRRGRVRGHRGRQRFTAAEQPDWDVDLHRPVRRRYAAAYDVGTWTSPVVTPDSLHRAGRVLERRHARRHVGAGHGARQGRRRLRPPRSTSWAGGPRTPRAIHRTSVPAQGDTLATVAIDTLIARKGRTLTDWQLTVSLYRKHGTTATPSVSLVGAMASRCPAVKKVPASPFGGAEGTELDVPPLSQEIHRGHYPQYNGGGEAWCSPTSTAMILGYWDRGPTALGPADRTGSGTRYADPQVDYAAREHLRLGLRRRRQLAVQHGVRRAVRAGGVRDPAAVARRGGAVHRGRHPAGRVGVLQGERARPARATAPTAT